MILCVGGSTFFCCKVCMRLGNEIMCVGVCVIKQTRRQYIIFYMVQCVQLNLCENKCI